MAAESINVTIDWDPTGDDVSSITGTLAASDVFNSWDLSFALTTRCSGGFGLADFSAANTSDAVDPRCSCAPPDRPAWGVITTGCTLELVSPPDGPLELSCGDLPAWAQGRLITVGAPADCQDPPSRVSDGDPLVLVEGLPVARVGDPVDGGGTLASG